MPSAKPSQRAKPVATERHVALLRAINLGGVRTIKMADLRAMFEAAGATDVKTYIASGNVVFRHALTGPALVEKLAKQIARDAGFTVPVVVRTATELAAVVAARPFDAEHLYVSFLDVAPPSDALSTVDAAKFEPERFALLGRELYLYLPNGAGRSPLATTIARQKSVADATSRNWRTVTALLALAE